MRWCDFSFCVPLAEIIVDHVDRGRGSEVERVIVVVCMVVGNKGCEVVIVVYAEDGDWVE